MPIAAPPPAPAPPPTSATTKGGKGTSVADQLIDERIREACRALWWAEIVRCCLRLVILSIGVLLIWVVIDQWVYSPGTGVRVALFLAACVGVVWYVSRRIVPLMGSSIRPEYAARSLERDLPELRQSLTSYVTLRDDRDTSGLRSRVVRSIGSLTAGRLRRHDALPDEATGTLRWWVATAAALALLVAYAVVSPKNTLQSVARFAAPIASIDPARRVSIREVQPGDIEAIAGRTVEVSAVIHGMRSDEEAFCRWDLPSGHQEIVLSKEPDSRKHSGGLWLPHSARGEVEYVITAGDAEAGPYRLRVQDVPVVALQSVHYEPPRYTGQPAHTSSSGAIAAIDGTRVKILATTNRAVAKAKIEFNPRALGELIRATAGATEMEIDSTGTSLSVSFRLRSARGRSAAVELESYRIKVWDAVDQSNPDPIIYPIRVVADLPPEVSITMPRTSPKDVPIDAQQIIEVHASDPDFGLKEIALEIRSGIDMVGEPIVWSDPQGATGNRVTEYRFRPAQQGLRIGDTVRIVAIATDNRSIEQDPSVEPNVTRTDPIELKIIASEPLPEEGDPSAGGLSSPDDRPASDHASEDQDQDSSGQGGEKGGQGQSGGGGKSGEQQSGDSQSGEGQSGEGQSGSGGSGDSGERQGEGQSGEEGAAGENDSTRDGGGEGSSPQQDESRGGSSESSQDQSPSDADAPKQTGQPDQGASGSTGQPSGQGAGSAEESDRAQDMQKRESGDSASSGQGSSSSPGESGAGQRGTSGENAQGSPDARGSRDATQGDPAGSQGGANGAGSDQRDASDAPKHDGETFERIRDYLEKKQQELQKQNEGSGSEQTPGDSSESASGSAKSRRQRDSGGGESSRAESDKDASRGGTSSGSRDQPQQGSEKDTGGKSGQPDEATQTQSGDSESSADAGGQEGRQTGSDRTDEGQKSPSDDKSGQEGSDQAGSGDSKEGAPEAGSQEPATAREDQSSESGERGSPGDDAPGEEATDREQSSSESDREGSPGSQSDNQASPSGGPDSTPSASKAGAGEGGDGSGQSEETPVPPDPVNLEYAKQATDLVLDYLKQTRDAPDQGLLEELNWTEDDLQRFADRWQKVRELAEEADSDPTTSRDVEEALKSLGLRPATQAGEKVRESGDSLRSIRDSGNRKPPPAAYRDAFDAFRRAVGRSTQTP